MDHSGLSSRESSGLWAVFLSEANRLAESSQNPENGSVGGERDASATQATWKCFNPHPLQNSCGSALNADVILTWVDSPVL